MNRETGIIMSGEHPKLILEGKKTMTRRIIKICGVDIHNKKWVNAKYYARANCWFFNDGIGSNWETTCPYGQVGDLLWVRETFGEPFGKGFGIIYRADYGENLHTWKSSIHMPRWASRIEKTIVLLRAERLREISEADARAEGGYSIEGFIEVFLRLNHLPEDANPWNWVIGW